MALEPPISVFFAANANYAPHTAACIASLLRHNNARFDIVIACSEDPTGFVERIRRPYVGNDRVTIEARRFVPPSRETFPLPYHLTIETYIRFWIHELLPGRSRALYLDPDTIVTGPIDELWRTDLHGCVLAAVPIPGSTRPATHGMLPGSAFFNAGVLLVDVDAWRERDYLRRCLDYLMQYPERAIDGDQDILNLCTIGDWLPLDYRWNVISPFYRPSHDLQLPAAEIARVRAQARIVHFNGSNKPWTYLGEHPRKADYLLHRAATDWRDWRPADRTPLNRLRKGLGPYVPGWAKANAKALVRAARA